MHTHTDEAIDLWGEVYRLCQIHALGLTFENFLADPWQTLRAMGQEDAPDIIQSGFLPLLPKQAEIRKRLDRENQVLVIDLQAQARTLDHRNQNLRLVH